MAKPMRFQVDDEVAHPKRPEWGTGVVKDIAAIKHDGKDAQRVTVDFANHKTVTINTAVAPLSLCHRPPEDNTPNPLRQPSRYRLDGHSIEKNETPDVAGLPGGTATAEKPARGTKPGSGSDKTWLESMEGGQHVNHTDLYALPDECTNPFTEPEQKFRATLETYRFSREPKALIDWAVVQTGLNDPLTRYTRSELEHAFPRFERDRNQHLFLLYRDFKHRNQLGIVQDITNEVGIPAATAAVRKLMPGGGR